MNCGLCHPAVDSIVNEASNSNEEFGQYVHLANLHDESRNRSIPYARAGNSQGDPILFFPPLGVSRRMLLVLKEALEMHSLWAICVSRPGSEGTTAESNPSSQVEMFCADTIAVMDALKIDKAGIVCMCAGTSFAMAFCKKHSDRTTGKFLALGPWTLPADCPHSKRIDRMAALYLPKMTVSSLVGSIQYTALNFFSKESIARVMQNKCSESEQSFFQERYKGQPEGAFVRELEWVMENTYNEKMDVAVCMSKSTELGFTYDDLKDQDIVIWQGSEDKIAHPPATKWLTKQLPRATLHIIPESTHQGALLVLGSEYANAFAHVKLTT